MKNNQKGFSVLLAAVIVAAMALAGGGAYFYTTRIVNQEAVPVPLGESEVVLTAADATSSAAGADTVPAAESGENLVWQTYRNKEYGFEIGYPGDRLVSSYENKLVRFVTVEDIGFEAKCKENEAELFGKKVAFGSTGCLFGIFISIINREALDELYSMAPYENKSIRDGCYNFFQLNRDYLAPDFAAAIRIESSDKFIVFESFNTQDDVLARMLSAFKFIDGVGDGGNLQSNLSSDEIYDPLFNKYLAGEKFNGTLVSPDFNNNRELSNYKTRITDAYDAYKSGEYDNMLFAGRYVFTFWGCGTSCRA